MNIYISAVCKGSYSGTWQLFVLLVLVCMILKTIIMHWENYLWITSRKTEMTRFSLYWENGLPMTDTETTRYLIFKTIKNSGWARIHTSFVNSIETYLWLLKGTLKIQWWRLKNAIFTTRIILFIWFRHGMVVGIK